MLQLLAQAAFGLHYYRDLPRRWFEAQKARRSMSDLWRAITHARTDRLLSLSKPCDDSMRDDRARVRRNPMAREKDKYLQAEHQKTSLLLGPAGLYPENDSTMMTLRANIC
jgi:hypothetical protein